MSAARTGPATTSTALLAAAVLLGSALRLVWPGDMEYKLDEAQMVDQVANDPWAWSGVVSGGGIRNPGMGIWVHSALARGLGLEDPVSLVQGVMVLNVLALVGLAVFVLRVVPAREREPWLWATALLAVSPVAILLSRKIWIPSVISPFVLATLVGWWHRRTRAGAFVWGLAGACIGQIHMSGFFLAGGVAAFTLALDRAEVRWRWWLGGSALGALPLIPWAIDVLTLSGGNTDNTLPGQFWVQWAAYAFGAALRESLGGDLDRFLAHPSGLHLTVVAAAVTALCGAAVAASAARHLWPHRRRPLAFLRAGRSDTKLLLIAALIGFGGLLTLTTATVYRHYLVVAFILPFLSVAVAALVRPVRGRRLLAALVVAQAALSVLFLSYVHVNDGVPGGDYGVSYRAQPEHPEPPPLP